MITLKCWFEIYLFKIFTDGGDGTLFGGPLVPLVLTAGGGLVDPLLHPLRRPHHCDHQSAFCWQVWPLIATRLVLNAKFQKCKFKTNMKREPKKMTHPPGFINAKPEGRKTAIGRNFNSCERLWPWRPLSKWRRKDSGTLRQIAK